MSPEKIAHASALHVRLILWDSDGCDTICANRDIGVVKTFKHGGEVSGCRFYDRKADAKRLHRRLVDGATNVVL